MGVTSSGLLDEERDATASSMSARESDSPDNTLTLSGEKSTLATALTGQDAAGTIVKQGSDLKTGQIWLSGPCIYTLP